MLSYYGKFKRIYPAGVTLATFAAFLLNFAHPRAVYAIDTALGNIIPSSSGIAEWAVRTGFYMVSGIGVILVMYGAIKYNLSKGDPRALDDARETITAALAGLVIVALAATIMGYLGGDLLGLPEVSGGGGRVVFPD